jgi:hypothetical protein
MNVAELIEILKTVPQDYLVWTVHDSNPRPRRVEAIDVEVLHEPLDGYGYLEDGDHDCDWIVLAKEEVK